MTYGAFDDRLDPGTYADAEPVGLGVGPRDINPQDLDDDCWLYVPEPLFDRIRSLGAAYALHYISILHHQNDTVLDSKQCQGFAEELRFIGRVVRDRALAEALETCLQQTTKVERNSGLALVVSPP